MNAASEQLLAEHQGFRILRRDGALVFVDKNTRAPAIAAFVALGLCALFATTCLTFLLMGTAGPRQDLLFAVLPLATLAVLAGLAGRFAYRTYRARAAGPGECLVADDGVLRSADGRAQAQLREVRIDIRIDPTDGMGGLRFARVLWLRWPGGGRAVFKSYDQGELARLGAELAKAGIR